MGPVVGLTESQIESRLLAILAEEVECPVDSLSNSTSLRKDLELDSLELLALMLTVEDAFGVDLPNHPNFCTVGDVVTYLKETL